MSCPLRCYDHPCQNRRTWATFHLSGGEAGGQLMSLSVDRRRTRLVHWFALAVVAACLASANVSLANPPKPAAEQVRLFEWFSTLGFPDVKNAKFVRYPVGASQSEVWFANGFLLGQNKDAWTVLTFGLKQELVPKKPEYPKKRPVDWACQEQNLATFVKAVLAAQAKADPAHDSAYEYRGHSKTTWLFFLAWACWRQGLDEPAARLFAIAADLRDRQLGLAPGIATLQRRIAADLAQEEIVQAQRDLGGDETSRQKVLSRLESIPKKFPGLEVVSLAQEMARVLRQMVQEDSEHANKKKNRKPFAERTRQEQVAELIFELRDQHAEFDRHFSHRRRIDIFDDGRPAGESPAARLFKLGYDAVPQLVDALSDERFSRTIDFAATRHERLPYDSRYSMLTVGDCALQILERLACRKLYKRFDRLMSEPPSAVAAVKKAASEWNDELQSDLKKKGERQVLVDALQKADWESIHLVEPLRAKYPDAVLPALAAASRKAEDKDVLFQLVDLMDETAADRLIPFLFNELKTSSSLDERVGVARLLARHGRSDGLALLTAEWKKSATRAIPSGSLVELAFYLGMSGTLDAVNALAEGLDKRPMKLRLAVVRSFALDGSMSGGGSGPFVEVLFHSDFGREPQKPINVNDKVLVAAVVDLLIGELADTEPLSDLEVTWGNATCLRPRIADIAGQVLHQLDGRRFPFDLSAGVPERDRQRVLLINAWRQARHLPEVQLPKPLVIAPVAEATLRPLLDRLGRANADAKAAAERDIEKLGPGAVAGILKRGGQLEPADPLRKDLERLAQRLAQTIVDIQFADRSLKPTLKIAATLAAMKGKCLDSATLLDLAVGLMDETTPPVHGYRLDALRAGLGRGVVLRVDLMDKARNNELQDRIRSSPVPQGKHGRVWWQNSLSAQVDGQRIFNGSGDGIEIDQAMLQMLGDTAFASDLRKPLEINIECVGHWIE